MGSLHGEKESDDFSSGALALRSAFTTDDRLKTRETEVL